MKKVLFIDRDGTLVIEPPVDYQLDAFEKLEFYPKVFRNLYFMRQKLDFEFVMVTNQDGLGTDSFPEDTFWPVHNLMLQSFKNEGIEFDDILIDRSFPEDNAPTRKPRTGMLTAYLNNPEYDLGGSFVIGDRATDVELAKNLGCKAILLQPDKSLLTEKGLEDTCVLATTDWDRVAEFLFAGERTAEVCRKTKETDIRIRVNLDGNGTCHIHTGLGFFDHMLEQIGKHGGIDLDIHVDGDLEVDEHHTIEDTAIALGECLYKTLGNKRGIERYGYCLPMDDCQCMVSLDFGGRAWLVWDATFTREKIGDMPTEMFLHFFKSLSDSARMNLHITAEGTNEHHKIEGIFKALARSIKMAIRRAIHHFEIPSSKGCICHKKRSMDSRHSLKSMLLFYSLQSTMCYCFFSCTPNCNPSYWLNNELAVLTAELDDLLATAPVMVCASDINLSALNSRLMVSPVSPFETVAFTFNPRRVFIVSSLVSAL